MNERSVRRVVGAAADGGAMPPRRARASHAAGGWRAAASTAPGARARLREGTRGGGRNFL
eukprot:scaffold1162_cov372-Prasinococcus_capsulatus_cf.AAC.1